eukprot:TRINITY_DN1406_c0_g1_i1.p1 TRINITY_DN1406_c0_g1~~TRINITY_DN1406_c0_g1_i1.p1  ORF type:complete len:248 (-),score=33.60 TRINITY_DN1406_c0_g1_i1:155-898(-)
MSQVQRPLIAFDFDFTIVNQNTDIEVQSTAPGGSIPTEVKAKWNASQWTEYMRNVFLHLHSRSVTKDNILARMKDLTFTPGFKELIVDLHDKQGAELIIISDSNSVFINFILEGNNLKKYFSAIYTNPATWSESGLLQIRPYHHQTHCSLSSSNLCKGEVLGTHVRASRSKYSFVAFVGDGTNDFCPMLSLSSNDLAFVRRGYSLEPFIQKQIREHNRHISATIHYWNDGSEIYARILREIHSKRTV